MIVGIRKTGVKFRAFWLKGLREIQSDEVLGFLKFEDKKRGWVAGFVNGGGEKETRRVEAEKRVENEGPPLVPWTMFYTIQE